MLNEEDIILRLKSAFPKYIGDDAAVVGEGNERYVITKDLLIEDVHFRRAYFDPASLAHKALHVNLSDIASMGARPRFVLLGVSIPLSYKNSLSSFLEHFSLACREAAVEVIGGDTTRSTDQLFISLTAIGLGEQTKIKYRHTAQSGDVICVAGDLGYAHLGMIASERSLENFFHYKKVFLRPLAKVNEGLWLGEKSSVTAMIDLSDGLFIDLKRLCASSNLCGNIELDHFKLPEDFISACGHLGLDPRKVILTGGEDYGLLFTVKKEEYEEVVTHFTQTFGYAIKKIGYLSDGSWVRFIENGNYQDFNLEPFSHFGEV